MSTIRLNTIVPYPESLTVSTGPTVFEDASDTTEAGRGAVRIAGGLYVEKNLRLGSNVILHTAAGEPYTIGTSANQMYIQNETPDTPCQLSLFPASGLGSSMVRIYGRGTPGNVTNSDSLDLGYSNGDCIVQSSQSGTNSVKPLRFNVANTTVMTLLPDGNASVQSTLLLGTQTPGVSSKVRLAVRAGDGIATDSTSGTLTLTGGNDVDSTASGRMVLNGSTFSSAPGNVTISSGASGKVDVSIATVPKLTVNAANVVVHESLNVKGKIYVTALDIDVTPNPNDFVAERSVTFSTVPSYPAPVLDFVFTQALCSGFKALVLTTMNGTLRTLHELIGVRSSTGWVMSSTFIGDDMQIAWSIGSSTGQLQFTAGLAFTTLNIKWRAQTL